MTLRRYLQGVHFTVNTDHSGLGLLLTIADPSGHLMHWRLQFSEFDYEDKYKTGRSNVHADGLSQVLSIREAKAEVSDDIPSFRIEKRTSNNDENDHQCMDYKNGLTHDVLIKPPTYRSFKTARAYLVVRAPTRAARRRLLHSN